MTRTFDLRVQVQALAGVYRSAPNLTVEVVNAPGTIIKPETTDAAGFAYLVIPNYRDDLSRRFTVRIKYFERVLETAIVAAGQEDLAVLIGATPTP